MLIPRFVLSITPTAVTQTGPGIEPAAAGLPGQFATNQTYTSEAGGTSGGGC